MPATAGQKGRLAGAYLSYVAPAVIGGLGGNLLGNIAVVGAGLLLVLQWQELPQ